MNGIISFFTDTDNFAAYPTNEASVFFNYQAASLTNKKQLPQNKIITQSTKPDYRNLLFWEPDILLRDKTDLSFNASDHCSEYLIIVEGLDKNGKPYFGNTKFKIRK